MAREPSERSYRLSQQHRRRNYYAEVSGDANAKAVFCYVKFLSCADNNKDDRKRELADGAPAVGKSSVGFEVKSGYGDDVNWNLYGTSMKMDTRDYPFQGLE